MDDRPGGFATARALGRPRLREVPGMWFVGILAFSTALVCGLMRAKGMSVQTASPAFVALACAMTALAVVRYNLRTAQGMMMIRLKDFSEYCLLFMAICLLGVIASYPVAAASSGFRDSALARVDSLMHFDWVRWYAFVAQSPALRRLGVIAYMTIYLSPAILLGTMAWQGRRAAARQFLLTFWLAAFITLLIFPLLPAKGPLAVLWNGPIPYMPTSALYQSEIIPVLRTHVFRVIDLGALGGLVSAPSFHTVCGTLYIAAAWPIRRLRWPLLALNGAMLLATPVEGNHYLTDMVLGLIVALIATVIARTLIRRWAGVSPDGALVFVTESGGLADGLA